MLHLAPEVGQLETNCRLVEHGMAMAANLGAEWIVTPELCLTGLSFPRKLGIDWIMSGTDQWTTRISEAAAKYRSTIFFGHLEKDDSGRAFNTAFVIGPNGSIVGRFRKICVVRGVEDWASPGRDTSPISIGPVKVGVMICADVYKPGVAQRIGEQGAHLMVSCAAWCPEPHGPDGCWEKRSAETNLPLFVCNRSGVEGAFSFQASESVVVAAGRRQVTHSSAGSSILAFDWDTERREVAWHSSMGVPRATTNI